jgi:superfamily I DNA and/or RNA helicase
MRLWRSEVEKRSNAGLEQWARKEGLDPNDIRVGTLARQVANARSLIESVRRQVGEEHERKKSMEASVGKLSELEVGTEVERIDAELQELENQLDSEKEHLAQLQKELETVRDDAKQLLELSVEEQIEWAEALLSNSGPAGRAERVIELQSEWLNRFGTKRGFIRPLIERSAVVAATCVGLAALKEANEVEFDLCIIDEASKATAMESCVPMARAKRWVLVGDSKQLPPFQEQVLAEPALRERYDIESAEAGESLFERLRRLLPDESKVMLTVQYRMIIPIGRMISECFYDGKLESKRKSAPKPMRLLTGFAVNWLSTQKSWARTEQYAGNSYVNTHEAGEICELLSKLDALCTHWDGAGPPSVLVLSGYSGQVKHLDRRITQIRHKLRHLAVEVCTVDRVQGREANAVFFSVTRSNADRNVGFLRALERINVALSRARDLLVVVGDHDFVERAQDADHLQRVLTHIRGWPAECCLEILPSREAR